MDSNLHCIKSILAYEEGRIKWTLHSTKSSTFLSTENFRITKMLLKGVKKVRSAVHYRISNHLLLCQPRLTVT